MALNTTIDRCFAKNPDLSSSALTEENGDHSESGSTSAVLFTHELRSRPPTSSSADRPWVILYAEDQPDSAYLFRHTFEKAEHHGCLEIVGDGSDAIAYLDGDSPFENRLYHPFPNLLLLDINMPGLSGFDVLYWVRQRSQFVDLPVYLFSSTLRECDIVLGRTLGATASILKPLSIQEMAEIITRLHLVCASTVP